MYIYFVSTFIETDIFWRETFFSPPSVPGAVISSINLFLYNILGLTISWLELVFGFH